MNPPEHYRWWLYAVTCLVFLGLLVQQVITGQVDFDAELFFTLLGIIASGIAATNTSRKPGP